MKSKKTELVSGGNIDDTSLEVIKSKIDMVLGSETEIKRAEFDFYCEFLSLLKETNKLMSELQTTINMLGEDKLMAYFKEVNDNFRKEEVRAKNRAKIEQEHKKSCKKA